MKVNVSWEHLSHEYLEANFKKIFKLAKHNYYLGDKVNNFKFKNYLAKEPIQDNVILSGNRLFFLEPKNNI